MPRAGAITFGDLEGKLDVLRVACTKCDRRGQYRLANLIKSQGPDTKLVDWKEDITADCPKRANDRVAMLDLCGAGFPDLIALFKVWPRAIGHLDLLEIASVATEIDTQITTRSDPPIDAQVLHMAVEVDQPNSHHMHIIAVGVEPQRSEGTVAEPILGLADVDGVAINAESHALLAKKDFASTLRVHSC